jgi:hypothetical protein
MGPLLYHNDPEKQAGEYLRRDQIEQLPPDPESEPDQASEPFEEFLHDDGTDTLMSSSSQMPRNPNGSSMVLVDLLMRELSPAREAIQIHSPSHRTLGCYPLNYLAAHGYTASSIATVEAAYVIFTTGRVANGDAFVLDLARRGMPVREAKYLWFLCGINY